MHLSKFSSILDISLCVHNHNRTLKYQNYKYCPKKTKFSSTFETPSVNVVKCEVPNCFQSFLFRPKLFWQQKKSSTCWTLVLERSRKISQNFVPIFLAEPKILKAAFDQKEKSPPFHKLPLLAESDDTFRKIDGTYHLFEFWTEINVRNFVF